MCGELAEKDHSVAKVSFYFNYSDDYESSCGFERTLFRIHIHSNGRTCVSVHSFLERPLHSMPEYMRDAARSQTSCCSVRMKSRKMLVRAAASGSYASQFSYGFASLEPQSRCVL